MTMNFNVTGSERKNLVQGIGRSTGAKPRYLGMPSMAYEIGPFTVDRNGAVEFSDNTDALLVERVRKDLAAAGGEADVIELFDAVLAADSVLPTVHEVVDGNAGGLVRNLHYRGGRAVLVARDVALPRDAGRRG